MITKCAGLENPEFVSNAVKAIQYGTSFGGKIMAGSNILSASDGSDPNLVRLRRSLKRIQTNALKRAGLSGEK